MKNSEICVIVPCYNEEASIAGVLRNLAEHLPEAKVVVIDDGSKDNTIAVAEQSDNAVVLKLPVNLGIGGAVQTGLKYAARNGYRYAVKFDGDGQHKAEEIATLLKPISEQRADVVIGSRFVDEKSVGFKSTFSRRLGIKMFRWVNSLLIGQTITDNTSGFRAYNYNALQFLATHYPSFDYPEPEEVVLLGKNRFNIIEVSTPMEARTGGSSSISGYKSLYFMLKVMLAVLMVAIRPPIKRRS